MEHAAGMTHLCNKGLTYADICNPAKTWCQEAKAVGKWPPATHTKDSKALPSSFTHNEAHSLVQCFQKGPSASQPHDKSKDTCDLCGEKAHWANECLNKACFVTKPCSDTANHIGHSLGPPRCPGHRNSHGNNGHCQEGRGEQHPNKQSWKNIPPTGMKSTKFVTGCTFHGCSKCMPPQ